MQNGVHGTALSRLGLTSSSQRTQMPKIPSFMRLSAPRTLRSICDSRSRLRIANSRSAACCTSSSASAFFSIAMPSRFRTTSDNSASRSSRNFLYLANSVFVIFVTPRFSWSLFSSCTLRFDASRPEKFQYLSDQRSQILTTGQTTFGPRRHATFAPSQQPVTIPQVGDYPAAIFMPISSSGSHLPQTLREPPVPASFHLSPPVKPTPPVLSRHLTTSGSSRNRSGAVPNPEFRSKKHRSPHHKQALRQRQPFLYRSCIVFGTGPLLVQVSTKTNSSLLRFTKS